MRRVGNELKRLAGSFKPVSACDAGTSENIGELVMILRPKHSNFLLRLPLFRSEGFLELDDIHIDLSDLSGSHGSE